MDYTLSVFKHEANLKNYDKREALAKKLGVKLDANKPILFQMTSNYLSGDFSSVASKNNYSSNYSSNSMASTTTSFKTEPQSTLKTSNQNTDPNKGLTLPEKPMAKGISKFLRISL